MNEYIHLIAMQELDGTLCELFLACITNVAGNTILKFVKKSIIYICI